MVQSNKYYESRAVDVTSEVGLTTDQDLSVPTYLRNTTSFIPPRYRKSFGTSHYTKVFSKFLYTVLSNTNNFCTDLSNIPQNSNIEQILEATHHKTAAVWPLTSHLENYPNKTDKT